MKLRFQCAYIVIAPNFCPAFSAPWWQFVRLQRGRCNYYRPEMGRFPSIFSSFQVSIRRFCHRKTYLLAVQKPPASYPTAIAAHVRCNCCVCASQLLRYREEPLFAPSEAPFHLVGSPFHVVETYFFVRSKRCRDFFCNTETITLYPRNDTSQSAPWGARESVK